MEIGTNLAHYRVVAKLGEGGMGEVYRATDTRLKRDVAIKVLPAALAADPDRLARLEREAQVLAAVNHANIATIYGLEEADGVRFLVMELAGGESLAERLSRGPIPLDEALMIAVKVAEALAAAHDRGIVHRDLKPANIHVGGGRGADGGVDASSNADADTGVKVLDFGLAKAFLPDGTSAAISPDLSASPTMAAATRTGVILGTAAYMSPEQARGKPVDKRTDIWAFGCVVYEMLAGARAFGGETVTDVLAAIVKEEPDWDRLPAKSPAGAVVLLQRCLRKDARVRLRDAADVAVQLSEAAGELNGAGATAGGVAAAAGAVATVSAGASSTAADSWRSAPAILLVGALMVATGAVGYMWRGSAPVRTAPQVQRASIELPREYLLQYLAIAPDGTGILMSGGGALLYRDIGGHEWREIFGGERARHAGFSPDSRQVVFATTGGLYTVGLDGGPPTVLYEEASARPWHPHWGRDGYIYFSRHATRARPGGISRIPAAGGAPEVVLEFEATEEPTSFSWLSLLPGEQHLLYGRSSPGIRSDVIEAVTLSTGKSEVVQREAIRGQYIGSGHLIYVSDGRLVAVPFDPQTLAKTGVPMTLIDNVRVSYGWMAQVAVSETGTVVYTPGAVADMSTAFGWLDRSGDWEQIGSSPKSFAGGRLSPDASKVAGGHRVGVGERGIWIHDLRRGTDVPLALGEATAPIWTRDGSRIAYRWGEDGGGGYGIYWRDVQRTEEPERLMEAGPGERPIPGDFSTDGTTLLFSMKGDIMSLDLASRTVEPFVQTTAAEGYPRISPNGDFVAYQSDETGQDEVYVRPFEGNGAAFLMSRAGGLLPVWTSSGDAVVFLGGRLDGPSLSYHIVAFDPLSGPGSETLISAETRALVAFDTGPGDRLITISNYDAGPTTAAPLAIIFNWFDEIERLMRARRESR